MESLLKLDRFCQTAVCARPTQLYELSVHQWTQMLQLTQNQSYMETMLRRLQLRLTSRLSRPAVQQVQLFGVLLKQVDQLIQQADIEAQQVCMPLHMIH